LLGIFANSIYTTCKFFLGAQQFRRRTLKFIVKILKKKGMVAFLGESPTTPTRLAFLPALSPRPAFSTATSTHAEPIPTTPTLFATATLSPPAPAALSTKPKPSFTRRSEMIANMSMWVTSNPLSHSSRKGTIRMNRTEKWFVCCYRRSLLGSPRRRIALPRLLRRFFSRIF
jgi:hypothetical protein